MEHKKIKSFKDLIVEVSKMMSGLVKSLNSKSLILNSVQGFTVVELLVSISIFSVIISIAVGGFTQALRTQRQAAAFIAANSNVSLAMEQMVREIRVGQNFSSVTCPASSLPGLLFQRLKGGSIVDVVYCHDATAKAITRSEGTNPAQPIVADNVSVKNLDFTLLSDPNYPPRITIVVSVGAKETTLRAFTTHLQTTISARL